MASARRQRALGGGRPLVVVFVVVVAADNSSLIAFAVIVLGRGRRAKGCNMSLPGPNPLLSIDAAHPSCDSPNTSRRSALGANNVLPGR